MSNEKYLVINAGSSSLKFTLYEMSGYVQIVNGLVEKIGEGDSCCILKYGSTKSEKKCDIGNHSAAIKVMMDELINNHFIDDISEIKGVGHRILHGGEIYSESVEIDDAVLNDIKALTKLGPLHHPGEIAGIVGMKTYLPGVPQVAVFDTAFHQTVPDYNYRYAVPKEWYTKYGVRKYGFHGTSHKYITQKMKEMLNKDDVNLIVCHIGSGASISCVKNGICYDTTMGLTPLDGLIMGTRSGSIDPSIIEYICNETNMSVSEVTTILNKQSGLLGICGKNDFRDLEKLVSHGSEDAKLAYKMLMSSIIKFVAQYYFELEGNVDAIVFTAGMGENGINMRKEVVNGISKVAGVSLDSDSNNNISKRGTQQEGIISMPGSRFPILVIPTDEELMILEDTIRLSNKKEKTKVKEKVYHGKNLY